MGFFSKLGDTVKSRLNWKTALAEMAETVTDRIIPQGAAEIAQALFTQGTGYVPYGPGQDSMEVEAAKATGMAATPEAASPEPALSTQEQYHANLAMYAANSTPTRDQSRSL